MATDLQGEREFGKAYDARLIRRLWTFVRPYRQVFWLALLLSAAQQAFQPLRDGNEGVDIDTRIDPLAVEEVDEVLGRDVARGPRRVRTAAEAADGCVEHTRASFDRREGVRVPGVARVVAVEPLRPGPFDERPHV